MGDFKLPIEYLSNKTLVSDVIKSDLELLPKYHVNPDISDVSINYFVSKEKYTLKYLFEPITIWEESMINNWTKYHTNDRKFLKESQELYEKCDYKKFPMLHDNDFIEKTNHLHEMILNLKSNTNFHQQYNFIEWNQIKFLNSYSWFLQLFSILSIMSPIITLLTPLVVLLIPFILLKFQKTNISFWSYIQILKSILQNNVFSRLFTQFNNVSWDKRIYLIFSAIMYLVQIYQNVILLSIL